MQPLHLRGGRSSGGGRRMSQRSSALGVVKWVTTQKKCPLKKKDKYEKHDPKVAPTKIKEK